MKAMVWSRKLIFGALTAFLILAMSSSVAMTASPAASPVDVLTGQSRGGDVGEFREQLLDYYDNLLALYPYIEESASPGLLERLQSAKRGIQKASDEELLQAMPYFKANPDVYNIPVELRRALQKVEAQNAANKSPSTVSQDSYASCGTDVLDGLLAARITAQAGRFALIFAPSDMVVVAAGAGGTISAHPVKMLMQLGYVSAETAIMVLENTQTRVDACRQRVNETLFAAHDALLVEHHALLEEHDALTKKLAETVARRSIQLQVIETREKSEFLVSATEAGIPLEGVQFLSIKYAPINNPGKWVDITASATIKMVDKGLYLVKLNTRYNGGAPRIFTFEVKRIDNTTELFGYIVFERIGSK
ncbi:MAG: hypothetical protein HY867_15555 [Chloroflexi bacterium]|nr:hypothetical protein [Chloroflexota bacterium]